MTKKNDELIVKPGDNSFTVGTRYWQRLDDGRVQCDVCPRHCRLREGQRGLCFVRACENNEVVLTTYGRSSGYCIDPIEKKPLNHFLPGTPVLSFGTAGCNLACKFCQNWDISKSREIDTLADQAHPELIAKVASALQCKSVAFTYNDPVVFMEYAIDVAVACREYNVKTVAVTAGYMCEEPRREFYHYIDAANVDLKAFSEKFYRSVTGSELGAVLDTLVFLKEETDVWFELTTLLIPGENDSSEEIEKMCAWVVDHLGVDVPMHFTAFHPDWKMLDKPRTPPETLMRARAIAMKHGIRYAYVGNVHDRKDASTYCYDCGKMIINRDWYLMGDYHVSRHGQCLYCGAHIAGVFNGPVGNWGAKRVPVRLKDVAAKLGNQSDSGLDLPYHSHF